MEENSSAIYVARGESYLLIQNIASYNHPLFEQDNDTTELLKKAQQIPITMLLVADGFTLF